MTEAKEKNRKRKRERVIQRNASRMLRWKGIGGLKKKTVDGRRTKINKRATRGRRTEDVNACVCHDGVCLISSATRRWTDGSPVRAS